MKPWRYSLYTFNNDSTPILTYRHNLALVLILHSHLEHFDDLSFFGAIWVTRNIFLKPNFTQFSPTHFFFRSKNRHDFFEDFQLDFCGFFSRGHGISLLHFQGRKLIFFFMEEFISILNGFLNWTQITLIMHEDFDIILIL